MKRMKYFAIVSMISILCSSAIMAETEKSITVNVTNIPTKTGKVLIAIDNGKYYGMAEVTDPQAEVKLENIPDGKYKLSVFHDANGNWRLDMENNIPSEYCAEQNIEVTNSTRNISVALVDVKEMVKNNFK